MMFRGKKIPLQWTVLLTLGIGIICQTSAPLRAQEKGFHYAHRGGAHEFEENTMQAFRGSYDQGLRGFETDIRMSKDGELIILHDDTLDRTHNATGSAEHKTAAELRQITTKKEQQAFLFLDEFLDYLADKPGIYLELEMKTKNAKLYPEERLEEYCRKLLQTAQAKQPKGSTYIFSSFDVRPLKIMKTLDPEAELLLIKGGPCDADLVRQAQEMGIKRIACRMEGTTRTAVREAQAAGMIVNGWPGHTLQDYFLGLGLGFDNLCTDIPVQIQIWKTQVDQATK